MELRERYLVEEVENSPGYRVMPGARETLERLRQFLTLLGLTALVTGGVGVANAVATFIDRRRKVIATMKSVGATGGTVFAVFLVQVLAMALMGVVIGLVLGLFIPPILTATAWAMLGNAQVGTINLAWRWLSGSDSTLVDGARLSRSRA